jgi:hypothetical protein
VKRIVALLLFLAMQVPLMNQWGAVAYYRINRDYIAENLCVNRDKPMLNCNGQCYLAKKLQAAEEKEQKSNAERLEKMPEVVLSFQAIQPVFTARFTPTVVVENHLKLVRHHQNNIEIFLHHNYQKIFLFFLILYSLNQKNIYLFLYPLKL